MTKDRRSVRQIRNDARGLLAPELGPKRRRRSDDEVPYLAKVSFQELNLERAKSGDAPFQDLSPPRELRTSTAVREFLEGKADELGIPVDEGELH